MKKILFAKGTSQYGTLRIYSDLVIEELRRRGNEVNIIDRNIPGQWEDIANIVDDSYDFIISIQMLAFKAKVLLDKSGTNYDNIKYISICGDHPIYINYWLNSVKDVNNTYLILGDKNHYKFVKEYYPWIKIGMLSTTIGKAVYSNKKYKDKNIDVFFGGTYYDPLKELQNIDKFEEKDKKIAKDIINRILSNKGMTLESAARTVLLDNDIEMSKELFVDYLERMIPVDRYIRGYYRNLFIEALVNNNIKVHVYGNGWEESVFADNDNLVVINGESTLEKGFSYMEDSKIILNVMPWSRVGLHDRIANAMLTGAICVTNGNPVIYNLFNNGEEILAYDLDEMDKMVRDIKGILENEDLGEKISMAGMIKANKIFTSVNYVDNILKICSQITNN